MSIKQILRSIKSEIAQPVSHPANLEDWRLELKFPLDHLAESQARLRLLHSSAGFRSAYPTRTVNNIYFDSVDRHAVRTNLDGVGERSKVRLRWYGDSTGIANAVLEIKIKSHGAGSKLRQVVPDDLDLSLLNWHELRRALVEISNPAIRQHLEPARQPMLFNTYSRQYFETFDRKIRATIDTDIRSSNQQHSDKPNFALITPALSTIVVELKAPVTEESLLRETASGLQMRADRHSKYARGVLQQLQW